MRLHQVNQSGRVKKASLLLIPLLIFACSVFPPISLPSLPTSTNAVPTATEVAVTSPTQNTAIVVSKTAALEPTTTVFSTFTSLPTSTLTLTPSLTPTAMPLNPDEWMTWPIIPSINNHVQEIYAFGQSLGNDPHALSIFGDCQAEPDVFLGPYITDQNLYSALPPNLQQTVEYFKDSLNRESPTVKKGTTSGALLWVEWHENKYGCKDDESPMNCELRLHKPSFVLIMVGTHNEGARNEYYLRKVLDALLEHGVVPILSTKTDNHEGDNHINLEMARLAVEYNLPLWNFWPVTNDLPNRGLYTKKIDRHLGDIYLTEEALAHHRYTAIQVLDAIWRGVSGD